jgi:hypothetical protein
MDRAAALIPLVVLLASARADALLRSFIPDPHDMRLSNATFATILVSTLAATASAQMSGPAGNPPASRTQSDYYVPMFGGTAGIAIPIGRLSDDHAAGYALGAVAEYAVSGQPYSLRAEGMFQRFALKADHAGRDANVLDIGTSIVYRLDMMSQARTFVTGGIAIYNATDEGTRPGINAGTGVEIPLTGFSAVAEARLHLMLADARPIMTLPFTITIRF